MAEIMFSSDCASVSLSVFVHNKSINQTVGVLNVNSSKMLKAMDFKSDVHVSRDIPYIIL